MTPQPQHPQRCTADDVEEISQFLDKYKDGELFFYSKKTIRRMVLGDDEGRKPYDIFLTKVKGQIVGIAIVSSKSKTLSLLFVSPEYRNNGIGEELYNVADPNQILAKRKAIPYFARLEGCASHSSAGAQQQRIEQVIKELQKLADEELEAKRVPHLCNEAWMGHTYANSAYLKAIALLQAGRK